jgi:flagellar hook-length control protein FliK
VNPAPSAVSNATPNSSAGETANPNTATPVIDQTIIAPQVSAPPFQQNITAVVSGEAAPALHNLPAPNGNAPVPLVVSAQDAAAPSLVESARLVQTGGRTEMHIGINSESLGTVDVHAVMRTDSSGPASVGASITVQSHEAAALLTKELPALQGHLEERNVHVGEITVIPESLSAGTGMQENGGAPQESQARQPRGPYATADLAGSANEDAADSAAQTSWTAGTGRLSVMA